MIIFSHKISRFPERGAWKLPVAGRTSASGRPHIPTRHPRKGGFAASRSGSPLGELAAQQTEGGGVRNIWDESIVAGYLLPHFHHSHLPSHRFAVFPRESLLSNDRGFLYLYVSSVSPICAGRKDDDFISTLIENRYQHENALILSDKFL